MSSDTYEAGGAFRVALDKALGRPDSVKGAQRDYKCPKCPSHLHVDMRKGKALCVSALQGVITDSGVMNFLDIRCALNRGQAVRVLSYNFAKRVSEFMPVVKFYNNGVAGSMLRVITDVDASVLCRSGVGTVCTYDHPFFCANGRKILAQDLRTGDRIIGRYAVFSPEQEQVAIGQILGDGHIAASGRIMTVEHGVTQKYYVAWKARCFGNAKIRRRIINDVWGPRESWQASLIGYPVEFGRLRNEAYRDGKKIISSSLLSRLGLKGLAVWVMDDGCARFHKDGTLARISICTERYDGESLRNAVRWFKAQHGITPSIHDSRLTFSAGDSRRLAYILREYIVFEHGTGTVRDGRRYGTTKRFLPFDVPHGTFTTSLVTVTAVHCEVSRKPAAFASKFGRACIEVARNHNFFLSSGTLVSNCHRCGLRASSLHRLLAALNIDIDIKPFEPDVLTDYLVNLFYGTQETKAKYEVELPEHCKPLPIAPKAPLARTIYRYLRRRGLTKRMIAALKVGYVDAGPQRGYAIFPVQVDKRRVTWTSRNVCGLGPKVLHAKGGLARYAVFNHGPSKRCKRLFITEGPFDAIALHGRLRATDGAIAILGTEMPTEKAHIIADMQPGSVYICLDEDAWAKTKKIAGVLSRVVDCPVKLVKLLDARDPDELSTDELADRVRKATEYDELAEALNFDV